MAVEIFISYRRADQAWARVLHTQLRAEGIEAWYDVQVGAGQDWRVATAKALEASQIFVLLFSSNAAESSDIAKELAAAIYSKKLVVPVRIENIQPTGAFLYELASRNWVNAFENTEAKLAELAQSLARLVKDGVVDESIIPFDSNVGAKAPVGKRGWPERKPLVIAAAAAFVMVVILAALFWLYPRPAAVVARLPTSPEPAGISVAVLPFLNLSGDPKEEYFSDGMTEEITSALAKIPDLPVVGRTSAFGFKGKNEDLRVIGQSLGATYLLEGSVRKAGDRVRITAQLIRATDDHHVWTDSYDRDLKDVFAVQEDVAKAIATALQVPLGLKQGKTLVSNLAIDTESYQNYLRAKALFRSRYTITKSTAASALLEQVVAKHPDYAPAWALLAYVYALTPYSSMVLSPRSVGEQRGFVEELYSKAEAAARRAIGLDPHNTDAYTALGFVRNERGYLLDAEEAYKRALGLDPQNPETLHQYSCFLAVTGQLKRAIAMGEQVETLDPLVPAFNESIALSLEAAGENAKALAIVQALPLNFAKRAREIASIYAALGQYKQAANATLNAPRELYPPGAVEMAARLLSTAPNPAPRRGIPYLADFSFVFLYAGLPERALEDAEHAVDRGSHMVTSSIYFWQSDYASARKTERFKALVRKLGLVDYWRAKGWPEFCHPTTGNDFACH